MKEVKTTRIRCRKGPALCLADLNGADLAELALVNDVLFRRLVCETGSCCSRRQYDLVLQTKSNTNRPQKILPVVFRHPELVKVTRTISTAGGFRLDMLFLRLPDVADMCLSFYWEESGDRPRTELPPAGETIHPSLPTRKISLNQTFRHGLSCRSSKQ